MQISDNLKEFINKNKSRIDNGEFAKLYYLLVEEDYPFEDQQDFIIIYQAVVPNHTIFDDKLLFKIRDTLWTTCKSEFKDLKFIGSYIQPPTLLDKSAHINIKYENHSGNPFTHTLRAWKNFFKNKFTYAFIVISINHQAWDLSDTLRIYINPCYDF